MAEHLLTTTHNLYGKVDWNNALLYFQNSQGLLKPSLVPEKKGYNFLVLCDWLS